ncbi:MAG TPA: hypothetical protein VHC18_22890 [Amycolatopsis sp.]|nr:hypothetical protein [Amycolatopsis sp.]
MHIELTDDEAAALRDVLTSHLGDLSAEISHTDNPAFRRLLRDRRDLLLHVQATLAQPDRPTTMA